MRAAARLMLVLVLLAVPVLLTDDLHARQDAIPPVDLERAVADAFRDEEYERALRLIASFLERAPRNVDMLYNAACACSRLGQRDEAASYLFKSVEAGFRDFGHMRRDPDLEGIRDHPTYEAILAAAARVSDRGHDGLSAVEQWRRSFGGERYRYEKDERHRLWFATALDETSHREMRAMIEAQAEQITATLFDGPPDYDVLVAVPTPADGARLFQGDDEIGGIYQHAQRRLVARDIGSALRHELVHLLHYGHMERLNQPHRLWVQEGLASLYEDYELGAGNAIRFLPNRRHNIVHRRARGGGLMRWPELFALDAHDFMRRAGHLYPQVRSIFEYLADQQRLTAWYETYVDTFAEDPSGATAFERIFSKPLEEVERDWRKWVVARPPVDVRVDYGDAALGVESSGRTSNDGVLVTRVLSGSAARRAGIRRGDVIVAVDGSPTRSPAELQTIIASREIGERVQVRLRRGDRYHTVTAVLRPLTPASRLIR